MLFHILERKYENWHDHYSMQDNLCAEWWGLNQYGDVKHDSREFVEMRLLMFWRQVASTSR
jgi:hypothetical protein